MGIREGAREAWRTIVKKPIMPGDGEHHAPLELVGPFTTRIPESPKPENDSSAPGADLPKDAGGDIGAK
ncbi:MAG: hypothetical protein UT84_C0024G0012 [Candidatus Curtissbacteria bacterium GW2011_GWA1_40_16]|uniref:Uncharacterized protein n=1 Tax=Candidatus Curtissbacteria bacterium GW2011_GWA1_40_16 TaxID=1618405 RepID=A0A0G0RI68_9BACT|nr:MAG: hypothetical protein UT84_C0024G0012 [Candidatus Curtissbacteria bacterium GW2011_GWA1_40_16]